MFIKTDYKPELGAYTIKLSSILLHKMPAQHIVSTLEMITFRRRNMYKTKKYTLWSNFRFVFTPVWKEKRSYIRDMITGIILSVIVPVIGSMLSALVVGLLGEGLSAVTVIAAILSAFGAGVLGLFVYMVIAGSIHPVILLLLFGLSVIGAFCNSLPDWYENKIRDENARDEMTMQYIDRLSDDAISGKDIRVFGLKKWIIGKYGIAIKNTRRRNAKKNIIAFAGKSLETILTAGRDLICYLYLISQLKNGMSLTMFIFYLGIIGGFSAWFAQVSDSFSKMKYCSVHITDFRNFLNLGEDAGEKKIPQNQFKTVEVVFDHVTFCYKGAEKPVLNDISFSLKSGEHKALVGLNGAGKSTLVKLISGLYLPTKGTVYVNGIDTRELDREAYYRHESAVFQDTLYSGLFRGRKCGT